MELWKCGQIPCRTHHHLCNAGHGPGLTCFWIFIASILGVGKGAGQGKLSVSTFRLLIGLRLRVWLEGSKAPQIPALLSMLNPDSTQSQSKISCRSDSTSDLGSVETDLLSLLWIQFLPPNGEFCMILVPNQHLVTSQHGPGYSQSQVQVNAQDQALAIPLDQICMSQWLRLLSGTMSRPRWLSSSSALVSYFTIK